MFSNEILTFLYYSTRKVHFLFELFTFKDVELTNLLSEVIIKNITSVQEIYKPQQYIFYILNKNNCYYSVYVTFYYIICVRAVSGFFVVFSFCNYVIDKKTDCEVELK